MAAQHPEARALLERSHALLRRRQRAPRRVVAKLGTLATLMLDAAMVAALPFLAILLLTETVGLPALALCTALPLWLLSRLRRRLHGLGEAARWVSYHLAWLWDWFAEAFSERALARLEARIVARDVMRGWRQHRRALPRRPSPEDVLGFLAVEYGAQAALAFRNAAEMPGHLAARLAALRWSALIRIFGELASTGALWPGIPPAGFEGKPGPAVETEGTGTAEAPLPPAPTELGERTARRADLRDLIRRRRQDITTAFGWQLKTEAQINERDNFLKITRAEIAEMERELAALGG